MKPDRAHQPSLNDGSFDWSGLKLGQRSMICLLLIFLVGCSDDQNSDPVLVGHLAPLQAGQGESGESQRRALRLAVEEVNQSSERIKGRPLHVLHVDSHHEADQARAELVRMLTLHPVQAVLSGDSPEVVDHIRPTLQQFNVTTLTSNAIPPRSSVPLFSVTPKPETLGKAAAFFAREHLKIKKPIAIFQPSDPFAAQVVDAVVREWNRDKAIPVERHPRQKSVSAQDLIERVKSAKDGLIITVGDAKYFRELLATLENEKLAIPCLFVGQIRDLDSLLQTPPTRDGLYCLNPYPKALLTEQAKKFATRYRELYGEAPTLPALAGYEMAQVLIPALRAPEELTRESLSAEMKKDRDVAGIVGPIRFEQGAPKRAIHFVRLQKGQTGKPIYSHGP